MDKVCASDGLGWAPRLTPSALARTYFAAQHELNPQDRT